MDNKLMIYLNGYEMKKHEKKKMKKSLISVASASNMQSLGFACLNLTIILEWAA